MTNTCNTGLRKLLLPAFIAVLAIAAAAFSGGAADHAEAAPTDLTVGLDVKVNSTDSGTYNINSLPTFEQCVDVKSNVNNGFGLGVFFIDAFILNTSNLIAFNADFKMVPSGKVTILESNVKQFFGTSSGIQNLSQNMNPAPSVNPPVNGGTYFSGAVDTGAGHTGHGVLARLKVQGGSFGGGAVVTFSLDNDPPLSNGVTLTDQTGAHPGSGSDGLFDGPFINQNATIAIDQPDPDSDTVSNTCDNCDNNANTNQLNTDGDSEGNVCDADDDNDGYADGSDNCPIVYNPTQDPAACADADNDTILDGVDNCPTNSNTNQANYDNDSQGDVCDTDDDNDGVLDGPDNCDFAANPTQANFDGDALGDACEDSDSDGWLDAADNCKGLANPSQTNTDGDTYGDICDNCPNNSNSTQADWNTNLIGDACEDTDNDGWKDANEVFTTTKPNQRCATTTAVNDEPQDSQTTDLNDDRRTNISDIVLYGGHFNVAQGNPAYGVRWDLNMSNNITISDIVLFGPSFNVTCVYP